MIEGLVLKDLYCKTSDNDTNGGGRNWLGENRFRERDYHWVPSAKEIPFGSKDAKFISKRQYSRTNRS